MKVLKSISAFFIILVTTASCAQLGTNEKSSGNGDITTITRSMGTYDGLKAGGSMDFKLVEGKEGEVTIKGDANLMEYIITEVENNKLVVKVKNGVNFRPSQTILVTVPYETIEMVSLAGSGNIVNTGTIRSDAFKVSIAGSGDINLNVSAKNIESSIAGSGDIELYGSTSDLTVKIAGSGDFEGKGLKSTNVTVKITGSGGANVVCNGELISRITGSGDVKYTGTPTNIDTKVTGSGSVSN